MPWIEAAPFLAAALVLFVLPDALFMSIHRFRAKRVVKSYAMVLPMLAGALLAEPDGLRLVLLSAAVTLSVCWHGYFAYSGDVIRPEHLFLAVKPDHFADVVDAARASLRRVMLPVLGTIACGAAAVLIGESSAAVAAVRGTGGTMLALAVPAAVLGRALLPVKVTTLPSRRHHGALYGALNTLAVALRWRFRDAGGAPPHAATVTRRPGPPPAKALVIVVMGEGISPERMSLFGAAEETTPRLSARLAGAGRLAMTARIGFSGGVGSNASITAFLTVRPVPGRGGGEPTLFQAAKAQGFRTAYLSTQARSPIDMVGGIAAIDRLVSRESHLDEIRTARDEVLVREIEPLAAADRSFLFLYPDCNHTPYVVHGPEGAARGIAQPRTDAEIRHNYDAGLRDFDAWVDRVAAVAEARAAADPETEVHLLVTADHTELLGYDGLWGHNVSGVARCAVVPWILLTNRPDGEIARRFRALPVPGAFDAGRLVLAALGIDTAVEGIAPGDMFVNNALPFGDAGYMAIRPAGDGARSVAVEVVTRGRQVEQRYLFDLDRLDRADAPADGAPGPARMVAGGSLAES
jgi:hypothetical protein